VQIIYIQTLETHSHYFIVAIYDVFIYFICNIMEIPNHQLTSKLIISFLASSHFLTFSICISVDKPCLIIKPLFPHNIALFVSALQQPNIALPQGHLQQHTGPAHINTGRNEGMNSSKTKGNRSQSRSEGAKTWKRATSHAEFTADEEIAGHLDSDVVDLDLIQNDCDAADSGLHDGYNMKPNQTGRREEIEFGTAGENGGIKHDYMDDDHLPDVGLPSLSGRLKATESSSCSAAISDAFDNLTAAPYVKSALL
jgi:hypothetical protein